MYTNENACNVTFELMKHHAQHAKAPGGFPFEGRAFQTVTGDSQPIFGSDPCDGVRDRNIHDAQLLGFVRLVKVRFTKPGSFQIH